MHVYIGIKVTNLSFIGAILLIDDYILFLLYNAAIELPKDG